MLIHVQIKNEQDQVHIFQNIYFSNFQIHPQAIMYHFELIEDDMHLGF